MSKKILLVEDDQILGETVLELLEDENYKVIWVKDADEALDRVYDTSFDIFLLDVNIPFMNGFELLTELRKNNNFTPAIFITANVDINSLRKGFEAGADDYIKKPFDFDELLIRIESALQKSFKSYKSVLNYGNLSYDIKQQKLFLDKGEVRITPSELRLAEYFLKNIEKLLSKDELIYQTHTEQEGNDAVLRVQISKLKKIGFKISNIRSVGYRLEKL
ncbi:MAG: response regulator transcription factor [Campylobacterota bacterium]|nr:response regulator transcription factor [Campylobacterota bacterium]